MNIEPNESHIAFMDDMADLFERHNELKTVELIAVTSIFLGGFALLKAKLSPEMIVDMIVGNLKIGNEAAIAQLRDERTT